VSLRAKVRHQNGGHLVEPQVIHAMYRETISLFKQHSKLFTSVSFISVTDMDIEEVTSGNMPEWVLTTFKISGDGLNVQRRTKLSESGRSLILLMRLTY